MAGLATSGTLTHWFRDNFAKEIPKDKAFEILAAEASQSPPGSKGLITSQENELQFMTRKRGVQFLVWT